MTNTNLMLEEAGLRGKKPCIKTKSKYYFLSQDNKKFNDKIKIKILQ